MHVHFPRKRREDVLCFNIWPSAIIFFTHSLYQENKECGTEIALIMLRLFCMDFDFSTGEAPKRGWGFAGK